MVMAEMLPLLEAAVFFMADVTYSLTRTTLGARVMFITVKRSPRAEVVVN